jgi:glycosyltransferase involved in cell wall biosynthesis
VLTSIWRLPGVDDPPGERAAGVWRDLDTSYGEAKLVSPPMWRRAAVERANQAKLQRALHECRPDVVSLWHMAALPFGLVTTLIRSGIPLVYVVCDDWLSYAPRIDPWMRLFFDRPRLGRIVERVAHVPATVPDVGASGAFCFVSELTRQRSLEHSRWSFPLSTVTFSGIDTQDFPTQSAHDDRPWRWRLLQVGRLDERKGVDTAIEALAHLPAEARLDVLGRGDDGYRQDLQQLSARLGVAERVHFAVVDRDELRRRYREADVFLFPTNWEEPFGLVPVEAMACGTPVVATGRGGSGAFLIDGVNCLHFPAGDGAALAERVRRLAGDAELRRRLVSGGFDTAAELTVDRLAEVLEVWHVGAAERFTNGVPPDRRPVAETLSGRGQSPP